MKKEVFLNNNISSGQEITTAERGHAFSKVVFLLCLGLNYLVFLHSFHRSDYIETNKSGGQSTDCLQSNLCNDSTINTGLADRRIKQMPKTVMRG